MMGHEAACAFRLEKALQNSTLGLDEIHNDQAIHDVAEMAVNIEAHDLSTQFQIVLQQDGDMLSGEQNGEVFQATMHGKVEADQVTLRSMMRPGRYYLPYVFTGTCTGGTFSGDVAMGEYGNGTFVATRL